MWQESDSAVGDLLTSRVLGSGQQSQSVGGSMSTISKLKRWSINYLRRIHDRRAATVQRRRATYQSWPADAQSFARAMTTTRERHNSRSRTNL